jgi:hypothetical protein
MAHPYAHNKSHKASHRRVAHILGHHHHGKAKGGACAKPAHKAHGGGTSSPDGQDVKHVAEPVQLSAEGYRGKHRFKAGGKVKPHVGSINIVHVHKPMPPMMAGMMPPQGVPQPGPGPMGPGPALPPGLAAGPMPMRNQGGRTGSYGASSGMSRKAEYERMKREGH